MKALVLLLVLVACGDGEPDRCAPYVTVRLIDDAPTRHALAGLYDVLLSDGSAGHWFELVFEPPADDILERVDGTIADGRLLGVHAERPLRFELARCDDPFVVRFVGTRRRADHPDWPAEAVVVTRFEP